MKKLIYTLATSVLFLGGASLALADSPQPMGFWCDPYSATFTEGQAYIPTDGGTCNFTLPSLDTNNLRQLQVYKGTIGNATLINSRFVFPGDAESVYSQSNNSFGTPQAGDAFFAAADSTDGSGADQTYLETGSGTAPSDLETFVWYWGAPLTVTADNKSVIVGNPLPTLTATLSGLINGDTIGTSGITGSASCSTSATNASPVGDYPITCSRGSLSSTKYAIDTFIGGTLHITPVPPTSPLTVTANNQSIQYGNALPPLTATLSGFTNGDTATSNDVTGAANCSTTATSASSVGTYPITCTVGTLTSAAHYTFNTFVGGTLTITKTPLSVTAINASMTYGGFVQILTAMLTGFVNGDTATSSVTGTASCSTTATSASPPGTYTISCTVGTLASTNYSFGTFFPGLFTVLKAPLTVTAVNKTSVSGSAIPPLTATLSGFVNGQTLATSDVTGGALCSTPATNTSPAGNYPITCTVGTLVSAHNYVFTNFATGTLMLTAPPDHTPPVVVITNPLKSGLYAKTDSVLVTATVTDASPIATTTYWFGSKKISPFVALPLSTVSTPSIQAVSVSATDIYGNTSTTTVKFFVVKNTNSCLLDIISVLTLIIQDKTYPDKVTIDQLIADCSALIKGHHRYDN